MQIYMPYLLVIIIAIVDILYYKKIIKETILSFLFSKKIEFNVKVKFQKFP